MKKLLVVALAMIAVASAGIAQEAAPVVAAESSPLSFEATLDLYSAYVWRGCVITDEPVYQPGGSIGYDLGDLGSISAGVWANFDMTDANNTRSTGGLNELDYTLSYAKDLGDFSLEAGNIWYTFPKSNGPDYGNSTEEVYGKVAYNNDIVVPSFALYYDYNVVEGFYGSFALAKDFEINDQVTAGLFGSIGAGDEDYVRAYYGSSDAAVLDGNLGAYISYAINDNFSIGATLVWTSLIDSDVRDQGAYHEEDMLWGGINLAASF